MLFLEETHKLMFFDQQEKWVSLLACLTVKNMNWWSRPKLVWMVATVSTPICSVMSTAIPFLPKSLYEINGRMTIHASLSCFYVCIHVLSNLPMDKINSNYGNCVLEWCFEYEWIFLALLFFLVIIIGWSNKTCIVPTCTSNYHCFGLHLFSVHLPFCYTGFILCIEYIKAISSQCTVWS